MGVKGEGNMELMPLTESKYEPFWDWPWRQCVQLRPADRSLRKRPLNYWKLLRRDIKVGDLVSSES